MPLTILSRAAPALASELHVWKVVAACFWTFVAFGCTPSRERVQMYDGPTKLYTQSLDLRKARVIGYSFEIRTPEVIRYGYFTSLFRDEVEEHELERGTISRLDQGRYEIVFGDGPKYVLVAEDDAYVTYWTTGQGDRMRDVMTRKPPDFDKLRAEWERVNGVTVEEHFDSD